ncbi:MAG: hypothetical protein N2652_02335, partial [Kiritimatiellae bacterium]|nr:hypothetical protein [Kiritimatiellia bacterium]
MSTPMRAIAVGLLAVGLIGARSEDKVELKLELPKPMFVGTPVPVKVPNLEPAGTKPPVVMLPKDAAVNVARG